MRIIIAGGRDVTDEALVAEAFKEGFLILCDRDARKMAFLSDDEIQIVSGMARGVDSLAVELASKLGYEVKSFPADWDNHGRAAGPIRNKQMAE